MLGYLDKKLCSNPQTNHIIKLQSLLNEYDRENRFLNKQIRQLLTENKELKIDKLKRSLLTLSRSAHDVTESLAEKKRFTDGKDVPHDNLHLGDLMASKIVSKERQSLTKMPPKTDPIETVHAVTSKKQQVFNREPYLNGESSLHIYSFGEDSERSTIHKQLLIQNGIDSCQCRDPQIQVLDINSGVKNVNLTDHSLSPVKEHPQEQSTAAKPSQSPIREVNVIANDKFKQQRSPSLQIRQTEARHTINPSPQIRQPVQSLQRYSRTRGQSQNNQQQVSQQKRCRFIELVSLRKVKRQQNDSSS